MSPALPLRQRFWVCCRFAGSVVSVPLLSVFPWKFYDHFQTRVHLLIAVLDDIMAAAQRAILAAVAVAGPELEQQARTGIEAS